MSVGDGKIKRAAYTGFRLYPNFSTMQFCDLFTMRQSDTRPIIRAAGMQALKNYKDPVEVLILYTNTIVFHRKLPETIYLLRINV